MEPKIKTVGVTYQIKVNNDVAEAKDTLREARQHVKAMPISDDLNKVTIVKQTVTEQIIDVYEPQVTKILVAGELGFDV